MKILTNKTEMKYLDLNSSPSDTIEKEKFDNNIRDLKNRLIEDILTDNLIVLTGLGTSMSVKNTSNESIAPNMQDLWKAVYDEVGETVFNQVKSDVKYVKIKDEESIELLLTNCLISEKFESKTHIKEFINSATDIIRNKCDFITPSTKLNTHESFLRKMGKRPINKSRLKLFSTNYDLCFEKSASNINFNIIDGFSFSLPPKFDNSYFDYDIVRRDLERDTQDFIPNVIHLYKMHGSIIWEEENENIIKDEHPEHPLIIYPMSNKFELSFNQPFLEMMSRFQNLIRRPNTTLITIGYGYNDDHISKPIMTAIKSNISIKYIHVSKDIESVNNNYLSKITNLIKEGDSRLMLIESVFDEFVEFIPDLSKESEEEIFLKRIKKI